MKIIESLNKIPELLNMTKSHILRVLFCSIATMAILITVSLVNRVFLYVFVSWNLDIIQNNISSNVPGGVVVVVVIWNYIIGVTVACLLWKYMGLPKITFIGKIFKRFMDVYYVG